MKRTTSLLAPVLLAVGVLTARSSAVDDTSGSGMTSTPAAESRVLRRARMRSSSRDSCTPCRPRCRPEHRSPFANNDAAEHSVTADTGDTFDVEIEGGETAMLTVPSAPGARRLRLPLRVSPRHARQPDRRLTLSTEPIRHGICSRRHGSRNVHTALGRVAEETRAARPGVMSTGRSSSLPWWKTALAHTGSRTGLTGALPCTAITPRQ